MSAALLLYGATGFTGRLIAAAAQRAGVPLILAGRDAAKLAALGEAHGVPYRVAEVTDGPALLRAMRDCDVVLNAAGPFGATAPPLVDACLQAGAHYLDITGEPRVIEAIAERGPHARARKTMLMPGVGFDVVPSDGLLLHVARGVHAPTRLWLAISGLSLLSRGSAKTLIDGLDEPVWVRRDGALVPRPPGSLTQRVAFGERGDAPVACTAVSWGDVASAYYTTGVGDITAYFECTWPVSVHTALSRMFGWAVPATPWQAALHAASARLREGPDAQTRARAHAVLVAQAQNARGEACRARLSTPEAYEFTVASSVAIARAVLAGDCEPGFETPARVFGADFALSLPGVQRHALPVEEAAA